MDDVQIIVEGIADEKFIKDLIANISNSTKSFQTIPLKGIDKDMNILEKSIQVFQRNQGVNLLILDANGNFASRKEAVLNKRDELGINFELFLFPNNKDNGDLEDLLCKIINPVHQQIFDCFDQYTLCLQQGDSYNIPDKKTKVYAYAAVLAGSDLAKENNRDYSIEDHWDLNYEYLNPLKEFLLAHIQPSTT